MDFSQFIVIFWNAVLSILGGSLVWMLNASAAEQKRIEILLNRTREEMAKEYVTKEEVHTDINRVMTRLEVLDAKLDRIIEGHYAKGL